jgi:hypothetical protein
MIVDPTGALIGVTFAGGVPSTKCSSSPVDTCRTVFRLAPSGGTGFTETLLHQFHGPDGYAPDSRLVAGPDGALYGTTFRNVDSTTNCTSTAGFDCGAVFKLTPPSPGRTNWKETVIYRFGNVGDRFAGGFTPLAGLTFDAAGALIGTTFNGGSNAANCVVTGCGVVFRPTPPVDGVGPWTETVIHTFAATNRNDGAAPRGELIADGSGAFYGTTQFGGINSKFVSKVGTVYKLTPPGPGHTEWTETVIHAFSGPDGIWPIGPLLRDADGALYGTALHGGASRSCALELTNCGLVYKLSPPAPGQSEWTETIIHQFDGEGEGVGPVDGVIADTKGNLFGVCAGGPGNLQAFGTVFELTPPRPGETAWTETTLHRITGGDDGSVVAINGTLFATASQGGSALVGTVFKIVP